MSELTMTSNFIYERLDNVTENLCMGLFSRSASVSSANTCAICFSATGGTILNCKLDYRKPCQVGNFRCLHIEHKALQGIHSSWMHLKKLWQSRISRYN